MEQRSVDLCFCPTSHTPYNESRIRLIQRKFVKMLRKNQLVKTFPYTFFDKNLLIKSDCENTQNTLIYDLKKNKPLK